MRTYIDIKDCTDMCAELPPAASFMLQDNGRQYDVEFTKQKTGYGEKNFFVCPKCGSRRTKLYLYRTLLLCRKCYPIPIYRSIKNVTPGGYKYIAHKMSVLAQHEGIELKRGPFCYLEYSKPKYKHFEKWHMAITKLQALENMRNQAIFFRKRYPLDVIDSVLKEENVFLYVCNLYDLYEYFYDWEEGSRVFPGESQKKIRKGG